MLTDANICVVLCYCVYAGISSLLEMPLQELLNGRSGEITDIKMLKRAAVEHKFGKKYPACLRRYFRHDRQQLYRVIT